MRKIDIAMRRIQRAIDKASIDRFTPAQPTREVSDYLIDVANSDSDTQLRMAEFLMGLPANAIRRELLIQIVPEGQRDSICSLRAEHEDLQIEKETHIQKGDFDAAAKARDQQLSTYNAMRKLIINIQLSVTPSAINATLESLGWNADA